MKAVICHYFNGKRNTIIHGYVVQTMSGNRSHRMFKCICCGQEWTESINSPQILETDVEKNIDQYYPDRIKCTDVF